MSEKKSRVIVVGGGPIGMVAALALSRSGHEVRIFEAGPDAVRPEWRGSTIHPPTTAILAELGLAERVLTEGVRVPALEFRDLESDEVARFDFTLLEGLTPYPFRIQFEQYKLVQDLRAALKAEPGVTFHFNTRLEDVSQDADTVTAVVFDEHGNDREEQADWLIACDGAHSTVRKLLGLAFPGTTYPFQSLVAAMPFPFEDHIDDLGPVCYWSGPHGRFSLIRTPDVWRTALSTDTPTDGDDDTMPHPSLLADLALLLGEEQDPQSVPLSQHQLYKSHQRVVERMREGRILLAGDAAHLSATTGGMGLNSGMHDAWSLARAMAEPAEALDGAVTAWAEHRHSLATSAVQPLTKRNRVGVDATDREARLAALRVLQDKAANEESAREFLVEASMLRIAD